MYPTSASRIPVAPRAEAVVLAAVVDAASSRKAAPGVRVGSPVSGLTVVSDSLAGAGGAGGAGDTAGGGAGATTGTFGVAGAGGGLEGIGRG
ncbi:MAG TPA: hypothetical protein VJ938_06365, partial [Acidimicrobiia bacterium]|nr:hypothetical protein [Acidimicrobiia bacterium]